MDCDDDFSFGYSLGRLVLRHRHRHRLTALLLGGLCLAPAACVNSQCGHGYRNQRAYSEGPPPVVVERPVYVNRPPPPPRYEQVPPPPHNVAAAWDPGHWRWNGHDYLWEQGHYVRAPQRNARWVPGHRVHHERQWVWEPGHWA